jgi:hypothetical protein
MFGEEGADVLGDDDDAVRAVEKLLKKAAAVGAGGEAEDVGAVERKDEAARGEAAEGVEIHGGEEGAGLGEPDDGAGEFGGRGADSAGEDEAVAPALRAPQG